MEYSKYLIPIGISFGSSQKSNLFGYKYRKRWKNFCTMCTSSYFLDLPFLVGRSNCKRGLIINSIMIEEMNMPAYDQVPKSKQTDLVLQDRGMP